MVKYLSVRVSFLRGEEFMGRRPPFCCVTGFWVLLLLNNLVSYKCSHVRYQWGHLHAPAVECCASGAINLNGAL